MGDRAGGAFSRSDFLQGKSPVDFGASQAADIFTQQSSPARPDLWPKLWPQAGTPLSVPKVVIFSDFIAWPEFWETCCFDFPHDVVGLSFTTGLLGNYYYLDQWNTSSAGPGVGDFRYARTIANQVVNPYYAQHQQLYLAFREAKRILESHPKDPIYCILANWLPQYTREVPTTANWPVWSNDDIYWPGSGEANPDILGGHSSCDIYTDGGNRGRTKPDPSYWYSEANIPPVVPSLLSPKPFFGTNVLHMYFGHWCNNWGSSQLTDYTTYALSPAGTQIGPIYLGNYLGNPISRDTDGKRLIWRDAGFTYGYMGGQSSIDTLLSLFGGQIFSAANDIRQNFYEYRDFGVRFFPWSNDWSFPWNVAEIKKDQKYCPSLQFYFGFTFDEFAAFIQTEDQFAIDYSGNYGGLKVANTMGRAPDSPSIRQAISTFFPPIAQRVESYYSSPATGLEWGTQRFFQSIIEQHSLQDFNVQLEAPNPDLLNADALVEYVRHYFEAHP